MLLLMNNKKFILLPLILIVLWIGQKPALAQIYGEPIFRRITIYSVAGGVVGAGVGLAWWATDSLNPSSSVKQNLLIGFGIGCILGYGLGIHQAVKKTTPPILTNDAFSIEYEKSSLRPAEFARLDLDQKSLQGQRHKSLSIVDLQFEY